MFKDDLPVDKQEELDAWVKQFNKKLTSARHSFGKENVIKNITDDFILNISNNWSDAVKIMKSLEDSSTSEKLIKADSWIAREQYTQAVIELNKHNRTILNRIKSLSPRDEEFRDVLGGEYEAEMRFRQLSEDLSAEHPQNVKRRYLDTLERADARQREREDREYAKIWRENLIEKVPSVTKHKGLMDFINSLTPEQILIMSYQDQYLDISYFYEAYHEPILDPDSPTTVQTQNIVESLLTWKYIFEDEEAGEQSIADKYGDYKARANSAIASGTSSSKARRGKTSGTSSSKGGRGKSSNKPSKKGVSRKTNNATPSRGGGHKRRRKKRKTSGGDLDKFLKEK